MMLMPLPVFDDRLKAWTSAWPMAVAQWILFSAIESHLDADVSKSVN
jgi:hypothetical protein